MRPECRSPATRITGLHNVDGQAKKVNAIHRPLRAMNRDLDPVFGASQCGNLDTGLVDCAVHRFRRLQAAGCDRPRVFQPCRIFCTAIHRDRVCETATAASDGPGSSDHHHARLATCARPLRSSHAFRDRQYSRRRIVLASKTPAGLTALRKFHVAGRIDRQSRFGHCGAKQQRLFRNHLTVSKGRAETRARLLIRPCTLDRA